MVTITSNQVSILIKTLRQFSHSEVFQVRRQTDLIGDFKLLVIGTGQKDNIIRFPSKSRVCRRSRAGTTLQRGTSLM
jgi:uncharacterized cupin superfamily protein